jgi:hypothetical protein
MKTSGNLKRKRGQSKPRQQRKRGRPFLSWKSPAVVAPLLAAVVKLATEIVKLFGK